MKLKLFFFLSKTQSLACAEYVFLFPEFHDVKAETSIGCKELVDSVHSIEKVKTRNFNFYLIEQKYRNGCRCNDS